MIAQPYPLWVVIEPVPNVMIAGLCLVVGWDEADDDEASQVCRPIVVDLAGPDDFAYTVRLAGDHLLHYCTSLEDAGGLRDALAMSLPGGTP